MASPHPPRYSSFSVLLGAPPSYRSVDSSPRSASPASTEGVGRTAAALAAISYPSLVISSSQTSSTSESNLSLAFASPPTAQIGLRYSFTQDSPSSMQLLPPPDAPDSRPLYHISVRMNLFKPGSYVSIVRRGATESGPYAGEFEHGPHDGVNRVVLGDIAKPFRDVVVFKRRYIRSSNMAWDGLKWTFGDVTIHWEPQAEPFERPAARRVLRFNCVTKHLKDQRVLAHLATFYPANVFAAGLELIDHIILSILVLQRQDHPQYAPSE